MIQSRFPNAYQLARGQQQPRFCDRPQRFWFIVVLLVCSGSSFAQTSFAQSTRFNPPESAADSPIDLNLRIVWGGSEPVNYLATIELDSGVLTGSQQLGIDANDSSFVIKDASNRITIDDRETRFGGCDIRVEAKSSALLKVRLQVANLKTKQTEVKEASWPLKSLRESPDLLETGMSDCRLSIDRVPGDRLRVITTRSHLVYNADEPLSIQIQPFAVPWNSTLVHFECSLFRAGDFSHPIFRKTKSLSIDSRGQGESYDVLTNAPKEEGVYELRFKLEPKRVLPALLVKQTSIERVIEFVVYNNSPANKTAFRSTRNEEPLPGWQSQSAIPLTSFETHTLTGRLAGQMDDSRRLPFLDIIKSFSPIPNDLHVMPRLDSNDSQLRIVPGVIATTSLTNLVPGEMHRLSISTKSASAACRVLIASHTTHDPKLKEPPLANEVFELSNSRSINRVVDPAAAVGNDTFEVLFWPSSRNAMLEVSNLNASGILEVGVVQVDVWKNHSAGRDAQTNPMFKPSSTLELHSANVRKVFGADPDSGVNTGLAAYDDWRMFLRFAEQAANYCKANGFDSLATTVHSDGCSLFPTYKLSSNARFDTGTFSHDGRDPLRKDIVELMYRVMSRHGIQFFPMLDLGSPIRELEVAIEKVSDKELFQHRSSGESTENTHSPLYNPLSPRVQQAIANAMEEFEGRYRAHLNYQGYVLRSTQYSHLVVSLPIDQTNRTLLDRYSGTVSGNLPKDSAQREQFISQRMQTAYSLWLRDSVADFLGKLKTQIRWVSVENQSYVSASNPMPAFIAPIQVPFQNGDFASLQSAISAQWNIGAPEPIHVGMDKPQNRFESSLARFVTSATSFQQEKVASLAYRDNSRTVSKVRIWTSQQSQKSILVVNAGAVAESIALTWVSLPTRFRLFSSQDDEKSNESTRVEANSISNEWKLRIAAGEAIRIDLPDNSESPINWYSQETNIVRSLDAALNSLEQGIARLSVPQPRFAVLYNASFEASNYEVRRGRLVGWTTSLDPNATVEIEARRASDGNSSIKIESSSPTSIAWIQCDPFALPQSDRLFVSCQVSAEAVPQQVTISLSQFDSRADRFETIASHDVADRVQRSKGQPNWDKVGIDLSMEFQAMQTNETALYRLQVEVKGMGRIWLDDFSISTSFLRERERRDLRSELFLARTSLQNGDSSPAVTMLNSPRGRLIQWADSYKAKSKVMVSLTDDGKERLAPQFESRREPAATESKLRPIKRLRNYWWQRKE